MIITNKYTINTQKFIESNIYDYSTECRYMTWMHDICIFKFFPDKLIRKIFEKEMNVTN